MNIRDVVLLVFNSITRVLYVQYFAILVMYRNHAAISASYFRIATFYSFWDMLFILVQYAFVRLPVMGLMNEAIWQLAKCLKLVNW